MFLLQRRVVPAVPGKRPVCPTLADSLLFLLRAMGSYQLHAGVRIGKAGRHGCHGATSFKRQLYLPVVLGHITRAVRRDTGK